MGSNLIASLRPLIHPMLVHFPIALLFASVALDWLGYWLRRPGFTRAGFYTLALGALSAGLAALAGPDHVVGEPAVSLLAWHQLFALLTVVLAVALVAIRFFAVDGLTGRGALGYLGATLVLLAVVSLTGYYGGEMTYHQGVGVTATVTGRSNVPYFSLLSTPPDVAAKPVIALLGFLGIVALALWLFAGERIAPAYYDVWRRRAQTVGVQATPLWTIRWRAPAPTANVANGHAGRPAASQRGTQNDARIEALQNRHDLGEQAPSLSRRPR